MNRASVRISDNHNKCVVIKFKCYHVFAGVCFRTILLHLKEIFRLIIVLLLAASKYETAYACEGKTLTIECEAGDLINLIRANYGRFSITICNDHGNVDWSVNCMSAKSLRVLHSK